MDQQSSSLGAAVRHSDQITQATKSEERRVLIFVLIFLAPILITVLVGGYGFIIWMSQLIFGPPGA